MKMDEKSYYSLETIIMIVVIGIGSIGSVFNLVVFCQKKLRKTSTTFQFLIYLSAIDFFVLTVCSTNSLLVYSFNIDIGTMSNQICKWQTFLNKFLRHMSSATLMIVNIERVLSVCGKKITFFCMKRPTKVAKDTSNEVITDIEPNKTKEVKRYRTWLLIEANRVSIQMILVFFIIALVNSHFLFFFKVLDEQNYSERLKNISNNETKKFNIDESQIRNLNISLKVELNDSSEKVTLVTVCMPEKNTKYFDFFVAYWSYIDILIYSVIPFSVMFVCALIIVLKVT
jgi:hypothetical protein